jgi:putrescine aminotransferase
VSAAVATAQSFEPFNRDPLLHTSTFAGNPLAMAAAHAAIDVVENEGLVNRARDLGERLLKSLREAFHDTRPDLARDIRGVGLLIGIEFAAEHIAMDFMLELITRNVLVSTSLNAQHVVRFTPPAVLTEEQIHWLLEAVREAAINVSKRSN